MGHFPTLSIPGEMPRFAWGGGGWAQLELTDARDQGPQSTQSKFKKSEAGVGATNVPRCKLISMSLQGHALNKCLHSGH